MGAGQSAAAPGAPRTEAQKSSDYWNKLWTENARLREQLKQAQTTLTAAYQQLEEAKTDKEAALAKKDEEMETMRNELAEYSKDNDQLDLEYHQLYEKYEAVVAETKQKGVAFSDDTNLLEGSELEADRLNLSLRERRHKREGPQTPEPKRLGFEPVSENPHADGDGDGDGDS
eukprot:GFYU01020967.1.p1 GENE.GFYU01020967.1~~GFYU01020967.1.p1  ORF type:complete len:173 (+),score=50.91 GFYU01020967.1:213-731(+)